MKLRTRFAIGTVAFATMRGWSRMKRKVRHNAKVGLKRAQKAI